MRSYVLLAGHLAEHVERHAGVLRARYPDIDVAISTEPTPLGTAGALKHAEHLVDDTIVVVNGDTFCDVDVAGLAVRHRVRRAAVTLASITVEDSSRYGGLQVATDGTLRAFVEKSATHGRGPINAGVYVIEPRVIAAIPAGRAVSLEREVLPALIAAGDRIQVVHQHGRFVDIGTPESWSAFSQQMEAR
jgi:NDP-sugar pyrophosphorylase family protein